MADDGLSRRVFTMVTLHCTLDLQFGFYYSPKILLQICQSDSVVNCLVPRLNNSSEVLFLILKKYLFIHKRHTERNRGRDTGRGRSRLHAGILMWNSIPGLQDHAWAAGGTKPLSHPGIPRSYVFNVWQFFIDC